MAWQGRQDGEPGGGPADDETRTEWAGLPASPPPIPDAPPPAAPGQSPPAISRPPTSPPPPPVAPPPPVTPGSPGAYGASPGGWGTAPGGYGPPQGGYGTSQGGFGTPSAPVAWAPPSSAYAPTGLEVPGAPGLRFGSTLHRFLAYWLDAIVVGLGAGVLAGIAAEASGGGSGVTAVITAVIVLGLEFVYFAGMWTSAGRATIGMRLMKLQVGNAFDGRTLTMGQAVIRWAALGLPFQVLSLVPATAAIGALSSLWALVLLVTTATSPTRQGLHDRFANSAIVQPIGAQTPATGCLVLLLLLVVLPLFAIFALIFLGGQVATILSAVGESI